MGTLSTLMPLAATPAEQPIHRRIQARSRLFAVLFTILLGLAVLVLAVALGAVLFYTGDDIYFDASGAWIGKPPAILPAGTVLLSELPFRFRLGGAFALLVQLLPGIMILANLRGLFRLYAAGTVFGPANATRIKHMGLWLVAYALAPCLSVELLVALDSAADKAWFHMEEIQALILGGILLVIAQVMEAGREIEQDRDGFV